MIIYSSIILILLFCIIEYDIRGIRQYRERFIKLLLLILICVSGFAYRLGGDGIGYFHEFKQYGNISDVSYNYLMGFQGRMPGWVLLCTLCKTITDSYWFFKLIHAIILNVAYFKVIEKNASYTFTGILFYFVLIYFNQNFQVLREAMAISVFFFSIPYFNAAKWLKYYILVFLAMSFHEGASFLLLLPLIKIMGVNRYSIVIYIVSCFLFLHYASDLLSHILDVRIDGEVQVKISMYQKGIDSNYEFTSLSNYILNVFIPIFILYYYIKKNINISYMLLSIVAVLLYVVSSVIPIGYRLLNYILIFSYLLIADFLIRFTLLVFKDMKLKILCYSFIIFPFLLFKGRMYFLEYGDTGIPSYVQYYPYASIFEKYEDPTREILLKRVY